MTSPHWEDPVSAGLWDSLRLGGTSIPGLWTVRGGLTRRLDVKVVRGSDRAYIKDQGYDPAKLELVGRLLTAEQWATMQALIPTIHPRRRGALRQPLAIYHPGTEYLGVSSVYVESIEAPSLQDGVMHLTIRVLEWVPKPEKRGKQVNATPKPDVAVTEAPDPLDKLTPLQ